MIFSGKKSTDPILKYQQYCAEGCVAEMNSLSLHNRAKIFVATFRPVVKNDLPPIVFVPGMAAVIGTFPGIIKELTKDFIVHYVETREKPSSELPPEAGFEVRDIAEDLADVIEKLNMADGKYLLISYSLGATASVESFVSLLKIKPQLMVLIEPSARFRVPAFGLFLARYLFWTYSVIRPLIKLYLKTFVVDTKKDKEMYFIIVRALDAADARKLSRTLIAISRYSITEALPKIDVPTIVIGASNDTFHNLGDALKISSMIRDSTYMDLVTNDRTHSGEVSEIILHYLDDHRVKAE
jgi:hypothetical protein